METSASSGQFTPVGNPEEMQRALRQEQSRAAASERHLNEIALASFIRQEESDRLVVKADESFERKKIKQLCRCSSSERTSISPTRISVSVGNNAAATHAAAAQAAEQGSPLIEPGHYYHSHQWTLDEHPGSDANSEEEERSGKLGAQEGEEKKDGEEGTFNIAFSTPHGHTRGRSRSQGQEHPASLSSSSSSSSLMAPKQGDEREELEARQNALLRYQMEACCFLFGLLVSFVST